MRIYAFLWKVKEIEKMEEEISRKKIRSNETLPVYGARRKGEMLAYGVTRGETKFRKRIERERVGRR